MKSIAIIMAGFGNVGKAFARLLYRKYSEIENTFGLDLHITGISTASHGCMGVKDGFDLDRLISGSLSPGNLPGVCFLSGCQGNDNQEPGGCFY